MTVYEAWQALDQLVKAGKANYPLVGVAFGTEHPVEAIEAEREPKQVVVFLDDSECLNEEDEDDE